MIFFLSELKKKFIIFNKLIKNKIKYFFVFTKNDYYNLSNYNSELAFRKNLLKAAYQLANKYFFPTSNKLFFILNSLNYSFTTEIFKNFFDQINLRFDFEKFLFFFCKLKIISPTLTIQQQKSKIKFKFLKKLTKTKNINVIPNNKSLVEYL
jgi:hypothetical protein